MSAGLVVRLALCACLLSGLMQNGLRLASRVIRGQPLDHGVHVWWMTPIGDALLFIPVVLIILVGGLAFRSLRGPTVVVTTLAFPVVLTGLWLVVPRLHVLALFVLAAGVARLAATLVTQLFHLDRIVARAWAVLAVTTLVIAAPMALWPLVREVRDHLALPPAAQGAPNVLLLLWDTVRASSLDLYGNPQPTTPHLSAMARQGVVFDRAFGTAPYTLPSHSSLFTGRWAHELSSTWRVPLDAASPTIAEVLASAGYRTGGFSANRIFVTREFGLGRGFSHFNEHRLGFQQVVRSSTLARIIATTAKVRDLLGFDDDLARVSADMNHQALVRWLRKDRERPYFAFVNFMEAHTPYLPRPPFAHRFGWYAEDAPDSVRRALARSARAEPEDKPPEEALYARHAYEASIAQLDAAVSAMLVDLRAQGLLDNTLVIVTADHGEEFGEHAIFGHGNSLYAQALHVPLVMVHPGKVPPAQRVASAVSIRDIPATILDLAGLEGRLPGVSLRRLWDSTMTPASGAVLSEVRYDPRLPATSLASKADLASAIDDSLQVIRTGENELEVFDLATNLLGVTRADTSSDRFARLRASLPPVRAGAARNPD
jgi:arylsulfatase A-like enzyme